MNLRNLFTALILTFVTVFVLSQNNQVMAQNSTLAAPATFPVACSVNSKVAIFSWQSVAGADKYLLRVNKYPFNIWTPADKSTGDYARLVRGVDVYRDQVDSGIDYQWSIQALPAGVDYSPRGNISPWVIFRCSSDSIPTPTPTPQAAARRVFVTSTAYNGNLGGLDGADEKCRARVAAANLGGTWKAWLSDSTTSASSRLSHSNTPYKLLNGTVVANNWTDLTDGTLQNGISVTETGQVLYPGVRTGTQFDGSRSGTTNGLTCVNWATDYSGTSALMGMAGKTDFNWSSSNAYACSAQLALYCFEQ